MKFYKYRKNWSSNYGRWEYIRLPEGETAKSFFDSMANEYGWSEHFRGIDYKKTNPPKEWIEDEITDMLDQINDLKKLIRKYRALLPKK